MTNGAKNTHITIDTGGSACVSLTTAAGGTTPVVDTTITVEDGGILEGVNVCPRVFVPRATSTTNCRIG